MSIEQTDQIDSVAVDKAAAVCSLTIIDHLEWDRAHLQLLEGKVNHYLKFVESGEIYLQYPAASGCEFSIDIVAIYTPSAAAAAFLGQAKAVLEGAGFRLSVGPLGAQYADQVT